MNDLEAAIGLEQLRKFDEIRADKGRVAGRYLDELPAGIVLPSTRPNRTHVYHGFPIRTPENRDLQAHLTANDIESAIVYEKALYEYTLAPDVDPSRFPNTETATDQVLLLPVHANLSEDDVDQVVRAVDDFVS